MSTETIEPSHTSEAKTESPPLVSMKYFLEQMPSNQTAQIGMTIEYRRYSGAHLQRAIELPEILLECTVCKGPRIFSTTDGPLAGMSAKEFVTYTCKNCSDFKKVYCLGASISVTTKLGEVVKYGEVPAFGPPTPARLISLLGSEKDYFLKGRKCESQGLGIGAFSYYRRIVEGKRNSIFDQIIRVSEVLNADPNLITELRNAKLETQFAKAIAKIKHGLPQALLINGHNPLTLLHSALSEGLHARTDSECLTLATDIRIVLTEFVRKVAEAMQDDAQLNSAVANLLRLKAQKVDD